MPFQPRDPDFERRVRESFARQAAMRTLGVEFKVQLLAPARGARLLGLGRVVRAGRTLTVVSGELRAAAGDDGEVVALLNGTMMAVRDRPGLAD